jgi:hypothetical protein
VEFRKEYLIKISKKVAALEELNDSEGIQTAWEDVKHCIKLLAGRMFAVFIFKEAG